MKTNESVYYWHIHHNSLCESTTDIHQRIKYITENKPKSEIPIRLELMTKVIHPELLPDEWKTVERKTSKLFEEWRIARDELNDAEKNYKSEIHDWSSKYESLNDPKLKAAEKRYISADNAKLKIQNLLFKSMDEFSEVDEKYSQQIAELHNQEHRICSWNGKSIFKSN